jgi:hypothetical protein
MASVPCEIIYDDGDFKTVAVSSTTRKEYLQVPAGFILDDGGQTRLAVTLVQFERGNSNVLVQLPVEADSGANRIWISKDNYQEAGKVAV